MRILVLATVGALACSNPSPPAREVVAHGETTATPVATHGSGRDRWRGGGVYLDGRPLAVLRYGELPIGLEPIWHTQRRRRPFRPGEPITYEEVKVRRYRVVDYLRALAVPIDKIDEVHIHGARNTAIVISRRDLVEHADDVLFKFAGDTFGKPIPLIRNLPVGTSFDDLQALAIYIERTPPALAADQTLVLDGTPVVGIPYHGEPLREGIRVYVDNRLAAVIKRNQLQTAPGAVTWRLADVLARHGIETERLARVELIHQDVRTASLPWCDLAFVFDPASSGEIDVGEQGLPANALALFTKQASPGTNTRANTASWR